MICIEVIVSSVHGKVSSGPPVWSRGKPMAAKCSGHGTTEQSDAKSQNNDAVTKAGALLDPGSSAILERWSSSRHSRLRECFMSCVKHFSWLALAII